MKDKSMGIESRYKDIKDKYQAAGNPNSLLFSNKTQHIKETTRN